jgi:pimeloyl-ACP methyl ester carboxylesterase
MKLYAREAGSGPPLVILHGLFGSSDNWVTQSKLYSPEFKVYAVDLRNHGQSPHSDDFDYTAMVGDLRAFFQQHNISSAFLIGHSMGGKAAMSFALTYPEYVSKLVVVDIAPRAYELEHDKILQGLNAIPIASLSSRNEADDILSKFVPEEPVRQFLLKNLQRKAEGGFSWKINLPVISKKLANIGVAVPNGSVFDKPTLLIRGSRSVYVQKSDWDDVLKRFPQATLETMDTGHWVHAEKPQEFVALTTQWLGVE